MHTKRRILLAELKDKDEGGGVCVGRENQQLRETESLLHIPYHLR